MADEQETKTQETDDGEGEAKQTEIPEATERLSRVEILEFEKMRLPGPPCPMLSRIAGPAEDPVWQAVRCFGACPYLVPHPFLDGKRLCVFLALDQVQRQLLNATGDLLRRREFGKALIHRPS